MSIEDGCPEFIQDSFAWRGRRCGKPIKRNGLCGIHASAKERRERNMAAREDAWKRRSEEANRAHERLAAHGVAYRSSFTAHEVADILDAKAAS